MKEKLRSLLTQYKTPIRIVLCACVAILLVLALLTYVPITNTTRYDMYGYIVRADGKILEEFDFTITCEEYNFIRCHLTGYSICKCCDGARYFK